jgi:hypothetical protein
MPAQHSHKSALQNHEAKEGTTRATSATSELLLQQTPKKIQKIPGWQDAELHNRYHPTPAKSNTMPSYPLPTPPSITTIPTSSSKPQRPMRKNLLEFRTRKPLAPHAPAIASHHGSWTFFTTITPLPEAQPTKKRNTNQEGRITWNSAHACPLNY